MFEAYGELTKCKLLKGKAFIEYTDHASAAKAQQGTNEQMLDGKQIWVEFSGQAAGGYKPGGGDGGDATTLFVGNLGFRTTKEAIEYHFSNTA
jgi:RNA recognition motif-containing protein